MIPKILQGQEVKEFIDLQKSVALQYPEDKKVVMVDWEIFDFYNQPFHPEDILKFEGWEKASSVMYINDEIEIVLMPTNILIHYRLFPYPKTLNDFVHNCLQAELKPIWKKED